MTAPKLVRKENKVGGNVFEELFTEFIKLKYNVTPDDLSFLLSGMESRKASIPISIFKTSTLSSLEAIVKFLRENRNLSYNRIGMLLCRNPRTLAVTYNVSRRKMQAFFDDSIDNDNSRIPFTAFTRRLSILECICVYLKSQGNSYAEISRMIDRDQRTVWTVCKRAEKKLSKDKPGSTSKNAKSVKSVLRNKPRNDRRSR